MDNSVQGFTQMNRDMNRRANQQVPLVEAEQAWQLRSLAFFVQISHPIHDRSPLSRDKQALCFLGLVIRRRHSTDTEALP
jgi:hypothetical protein